MKRAVSVAVIVTAFGAWADYRDLPLSPPSTPTADISDGANEGNPHFYWLPPMVRAPDPSGTFDRSLQPEVAIRKCNETEAHCGPDLGIFNMETGPGSETVRVVPEDEHYIVNWHTDDILNDFPLAAGEHYRIYVRVGAQSLGHADVLPVSNGKEMKNVDTDEYIALVGGKTLPIKFRIEEGALEGGAGESVSAGYYISCAVDASGAAYCWGWNVYGQVGNGTGSPVNVKTPVAVVGGHTFQSVSAGVYHACGVTTDGAAYCWGYNYYGQLGTGYTSLRELAPVAVTGGLTFQSVTAAGHYTCGITTDGAAYCWGYNGYGQLGTGYPSFSEPTPRAVTGGHTFQSISALHRHTCGLATDGVGFCWGWNYDGQIGDGTSASSGHATKPSPTAVGGGHMFQSLDAGGRFSCGVTNTGHGYCWGYNKAGQLGVGTFSLSPPFNKPNPTTVTGGLSFQSVSTGGAHACGLATDGTAHCWGANWRGQLGDGTTTGAPYYGKASPVEVTGGLSFRSISAGWWHSCGVTAANDAYCWGYNGAGQLGDGTTVNRPSPVFVLDLDPPMP